MEIDRDGETVNLRLNLVARPHRLTRPRTIRFALQATPAKPMPAEPASWRRWWFTRGPHGKRHDVEVTMMGVNLGWGAAQLVTDLFPADEDVSFWEAMAANRARGKWDQDFLERWKRRYPALAEAFPTYKWGLETVSGMSPNTNGTTSFKYLMPYLNPRGGSSLDPAFATTYLDEFGYGLPDCKVFRYWEEGHPLEATGARIRGLVLAREPKKAKARKADEPAADLEAELDGKDPSGQLNRVAPGVFELTIKKHDFAIILIE